MGKYGSSSRILAVGGNLLDPTHKLHELGSRGDRSVVDRSTILHPRL